MAPNAWSGTIAEYGAVGAVGTGPCVGLILVPNTCGGMMHIYHFDSTSDVMSGLLITGAARRTTTQIPDSWSNGTETLPVTMMSGAYTAYLHGGGGEDGLAKLQQVIGTLRRLNVSIAGYIPSSSVHVGSNGQLYWSQGPLSSSGEYLP